MLLQLLSVLFILYFIYKMWFKKKSATEPPELSGWYPLIGHGYKFLGDSTVLLKTLHTLTKEIQEKGGLSYVYMGLWKIYVVTDPEDSLTISNTCLDKEYVYSFTKPLLGEGLITSDATIWKRHRKLLNPAFNQAVLNSFITTFESQAVVLVNEFSKKVGQPFDHEDLLRHVNLETICATAMGIGTGDGQRHDLQKKYVPLMAEFLDTITERFKKVWFHNSLIFKMSSLKKRQDLVVHKMLALCDSILHTKKTEMKINSFDQDKTSRTKPFLELILDLTNETGCFSDEEIRDEVNTIVLAGHETTASVLTIVLVLIGSYPEVQEKIYKEVLDVISNTDVIDKEALSKLVYTEAVLKETLRLYPIGPMVARHIDKPVKLKNYTLEANTGCFIFLSAVNRDPMWGPDRHQFRPERWLEHDSLPNLDYYGGFGIGRRSCIGKSYAMMSMKISLAHVIRRFKISANVNEMLLKWEMVMRPQSGFYITITNRN